MSDDDDNNARNEKVNCQDEENLCPNKTTDVRKGRGQKKGGQKLLSGEENTTTGTGERNTAPRSASKTRPLVLTNCCFL